jgi:hypothetical protein
LHQQHGLVPVLLVDDCNRLKPRRSPVLSEIDRAVRVWVQGDEIRIRGLICPGEFDEGLDLVVIEPGWRGLKGLARDAIDELRIESAGPVEPDHAGVDLAIA